MSNLDFLGLIDIHFTVVLRNVPCVQPGMHQRREVQCVLLVKREPTLRKMVLLYALFVPLVSALVDITSIK